MDTVGMVSLLCLAGLRSNIHANVIHQGLDIQDIELVVQWGYIHSLCTLMQWLGHAARDPSIEASGIYFVKKDYKRRR
jgi:hypothetical protein